MGSERKPPTPPSLPLSEEEAEHWQHQLQDVAPLPRPEKLPTPTFTPRKIKKSAAPLPTPMKDAHAPHAIERGLLDRIGKGREALEARLDLHGMTEAEAHAAFTRFIHHAHREGLRTVLVITGKGRGGEGTLRRALKQWLESDALRGYISGYHTARSAHGGEGAWYLRIRQKGKHDGR